MALLQVDPGDLGGKWDHDVGDAKTTPATSTQPSFSMVEADPTSPSMGGRFKKKQDDEVATQLSPLTEIKKASFAQGTKKDDPIRPFMIYGPTIKFIQSRTVTLANSSTNFSHLAEGLVQDSSNAEIETEEPGNLGARVSVELLERQLALGAKSDHTHFFKFVAMAEHLTLDIFLLGREKLLFVARYLQGIPDMTLGLLEELHGSVDPNYDPNNREIFSQWRATDSRMSKMHPREKSKGVFTDYDSLATSELTGRRTEAHVRTLLKLDLTKDADWKVWESACKEMSIRSQANPFTLKPQGKVSGRELWRYRRVAVACNDTVRRVHAVKFHMDAVQKKDAANRFKKGPGNFFTDAEDASNYDIPVARVVSDILHLRAEVLRMFVVRLMELTVWYAKEQRPFDAEIILFLEKGAPKVFAVIGDNPNDEWESLIDIFYTHHLPRLMLKAGFAPAVFEQHVFPALQSLLDRGVFHRSEHQRSVEEVSEMDEVEGVGGARMVTKSGDRDEMQLSKTMGVTLWKTHVHDKLVEAMQTSWTFSKVSLSGRCREELGSRPLMLQAFLKAVAANRAGLSALWWNSDWLDIDPLRAHIVRWLVGHNRSTYNPDAVALSSSSVVSSGVHWGPVLQVLAYDSSAADVFLEQIRSYREAVETALLSYTPQESETANKKSKKTGKGKISKKPKKMVEEIGEMPASATASFAPSKRTMQFTSMERTEIGLALFRMVCYRDAGNANGPMMSAEIIKALFDDLGEVIKGDDGLYCLYLSAVKLCGPLSYEDAVEFERMYALALNKFPATRRLDDSVSLKGMPFFDICGRGALLPTNRFSSSMGFVTIIGMETLALTPSTIVASTKMPVESHFSTKPPLVNFSDIFKVIQERRKSVQESLSIEDGKAKKATKKQVDRDDAGAVFISVSEKQLEEFTESQLTAESAAARAEVNELRNPSTPLATTSESSTPPAHGDEAGAIKAASARIGKSPAPGVVLIRELNGLLRNECSELFFGMINLAIQQLAHDKFQQKLLVARLRHMLLYHDGIVAPKALVVDFTDWAHFSTSRWPHTFFGNDNPNLKLYYHFITLRRQLLAHDLACLDRKGPHIDSFLPQTQLPTPYSSWVLLGVMSAIRKDAALRASRSEIREKVDVMIAEFMNNHGLMIRLVDRIKNPDKKPIPALKFPAASSASARRVGELLHKYTHREGGDREMTLQSLTLVPFSTLADFLDNKSGDALLNAWWSRCYVSFTTRQTVFQSGELIDNPFQRGLWLHRVSRNYFPRLLRNREHLFSAMSPALKRLMWCVVSDVCRLLESPTSPLATPAPALKSPSPRRASDSSRDLHATQAHQQHQPPSLLGSQHTSTSVDSLLANENESASAKAPSGYQRLQLDNNSALELLAGNGSFEKEEVDLNIPILPEAREFANRLPMSVKDATKYDGNNTRQFNLVRFSLVETIGRMVAYVGCPPWWDKQLRFRLYFIRRLIGLPDFLRSFSQLQLSTPIDAPVVAGVLPTEEEARRAAEVYADTESKVNSLGYVYREMLPDPKSVWIPGEAELDNLQQGELNNDDSAATAGGDNDGAASFTLAENTVSPTVGEQPAGAEQQHTASKFMPVIAAPYCFTTREANEVLVQFAGCLQTISDTTGLPTGNEGSQQQPTSKAVHSSPLPDMKNKNALITIGADGRPQEVYTSPFVLLERINYAQHLWPSVRPTRLMTTEELIEFLNFIGAAMLASNAVPKTVRRHYGNCVRQLVGELLTSKNHGHSALHFSQVYSMYRSKLYSVLDAAIAYDLHLVGDIPLLYLAGKLGFDFKEATNGRIARHDAISNKAARGIAVVGPRAKQHELKKSQKTQPHARVDSVRSILDDDVEGADGAPDMPSSSQPVEGHNFGGSGGSSGNKKKKKKKNKNNKGNNGGTSLF